MASLMDSDLASLAATEWCDIAVVIAAQHKLQDIADLANPNAEGDTMASGDEGWEDIGREVLDRFYATPTDASREVTRPSRRRPKVHPENSEPQEREGARPGRIRPARRGSAKCSLILTRLGRELDRAFARFDAMQKLPT